MGGSGLRFEHAYSGKIDHEVNSRLMESYTRTIWEKFDGAFPSNDRKEYVQRGGPRARHEWPGRPPCPKKIGTTACAKCSYFEGDFMYIASHEMIINALQSGVPKHCMRLGLDSQHPAAYLTHACLQGVPEDRRTAITTCA